MKRSCADKSIYRLRDDHGISRAVIIMLFLVIVMSIVISIPTFIHYRNVWREMQCMTSLDSAKRQMIDEFLMSGGELEVDEAKDHVGYVMNGWDDLCPGGGTVYITPDLDDDAKIPYKLVCGVHGPDEKERTRLNAEYVLDQIRDRIKIEAAKGEAIPETVTVTVNSETYEARLVTEDVNIRHGTYSTPDIDEETVVYYGIKGHGTVGEDPIASDGEVCYFAFADEKWCANWHAKSGRGGDAWQYSSVINDNKYT